MRIPIVLYAANATIERQWKTELEAVLVPYLEPKVCLSSEDPRTPGIVFIDPKIKNIESILDRAKVEGRVIFAVLEDQGSVPDLKDSRVSDWVVRPFRGLEILSRIRQRDQILAWSEVTHLNVSFSDLVSQLKEDLSLAEALQKRKMPQRFSGIQGIQVQSRYFAGARSGGDYFDLAESKDHTVLSLVLTHSSSYGLSSAVLSALMRVTLRLSRDHLGKPGAIADVVKGVHEDLLAVLKEKDVLSLFYGTFSRKDSTFRFLNFGEHSVFFAKPNGKFKAIDRSGQSLTRTSDLKVVLQEGSIQLTPESRVALLSKGCVEMLQGEKRVLEILNNFRDKDLKSLMNEATFQIKSKLQGEDEIPSQDCSLIGLDIGAQMIRLTRQEQDEIET